MITAARNLTLVLGLAATSFAWAANYQYEAISDFTDINAGEVPYYIHGGVKALAINAAIESYREKFARASTVFEHDSGLYDVTITSLGEIDGDGEYRFLVNGELIGAAVNTPTDIDYSPQYHTFEQVSIPAGATISVESSAVSNGQIPEGDAYAFARGRWINLSIALVEEDTATPDPVETIDLALSLTTDSETITAGDIINYTVEVDNSSEEFTATNPEITITLPTGLSEITSENCSQSDNNLTCTVAEIAPLDTAVISVSARAETAGSYQAIASVQADQDDPNLQNNNGNTSNTVNAIVPVDTSIDLGLSISANSNQFEVGNTATFTITMTNHHTDTIATDPVVNITLPDSLQFIASNTCTPNTQTLVCSGEELAPEADSLIIFTALALQLDNAAEVVAVVNNSQTDTNPDNNEARITSNIITAVVQNVEPTTQEAPTTETTETTESKVTNGGGSLSTLSLLLCGLLGALRRQRLSPERG